MKARTTQAHNELKNAKTAKTEFMTALGKEMNKHD